MSKVIQLSDYRKFDSQAYLKKLREMSKYDLLEEMVNYSGSWQEKTKEDITRSFIRKGILLFTEIYHTAETPELKQASLTALQELEKLNA